MSRSLVTNAKQVDPAWLTTILRDASCLENGHVTQVENSAEYKSNSSIIAHLQISYSADAPATAPSRLLLKLTGAEYATAGQNEVAFYNSAVPIMVGPPLVRCYDAVYAPETKQSHLLLDDLSPTHYQLEKNRPFTKLHAEQAIDCLAKTHAFWWEHPQLGKAVGTLPNKVIMERSIQVVAKKLPGFLDYLGDRLSADKRQIYEQTLSSLPDLLIYHKPERLTHGQHMTLTHGDAHLKAFLYPREANKAPLYIIDWAIWQIRLGTSDPAYMMGLYWHPKQRQALEEHLLRHYYSCLQKYGIENYNWDDCWLDYKLSAIRNLFVPVWQWPEKTAVAAWWQHWERTLTAFQDLNCAELLSI